MGSIGIDSTAQRYLFEGRTKFPIRHSFPCKLLLRFRGVIVYKRGTYAAIVVSYCYPGVESIVRLNAALQRDRRSAARFNHGNFVQPDGGTTGARRSAASVH